MQSLRNKLTAILALSVVLLFTACVSSSVEMAVESMA